MSEMSIFPSSAVAVAKIFASMLSRSLGALIKKCAISCKSVTSSTRSEISNSPSPSDLNAMISVIC